MKKNFNHFKIRWKKRFNYNLSWKKINNINKMIKNGNIPIAFVLDNKIDIYSYNYKIKKICFIFYDKQRKVPITVYTDKMLERKIKHLKDD